MRTLALSLLIAGLAAGPTLAENGGPGRGNGGGGGNGGDNSKSAELQVTNMCDEAVQVTVDVLGSRVLEPYSTTTFGFFAGRLSDPTLTASLVSDPSISDSERCRLKDGETTIATVTCSSTASGTTLEVNCLRPGETLAFSNRESAVTLASAGGLGFLLLLGMLLGRAPGRPRRESSPAPSRCLTRTLARIGRV